jgi:hypothetical protein
MGHRRLVPGIFEIRPNRDLCAPIRDEAHRRGARTELRPARPVASGIVRELCVRMRKHRTCLAGVDPFVLERDRVEAGQVAMKIDPTKRACRGIGIESSGRAARAIPVPRRWRGAVRRLASPATTDPFARRLRRRARAGRLLDGDRGGDTLLLDGHGELPADRELSLSWRFDHAAAEQRRESEHLKRRSLHRGAT